MFKAFAALPEHPSVIPALSSGAHKCLELQGPNALKASTQIHVRCTHTDSFTHTQSIFKNKSLKKAIEGKMLAHSDNGDFPQVTHSAPGMGLCSSIHKDKK